MFTQEQYDQILKLISIGTGENASFAGTSKIFVTNENVKDENWIVDSGATNYMVHTRELLDRINTDVLGNAPKVYLPDGTSLDVECTGESRTGENSTVKNDLHSEKVNEIGKELEGLYNLQHQKLKAKAANVHLQKSTMQGEDLKSSHVHTPQQNGVVERKQRNILEVARAIRLQGYLPLKFWGECVQATIYVINRLPLSVLSGKSSFEILYGRVPSLKHLRTIGCLCFAKVVGEKDKFAARSVGAMLMGYSLSQKGYTLYNILTNSFFINTYDDDASLSAMPPIADNHTADTQPSSPLPLFSEDTPAQQSPLSE
uniref:Retroviral polymerase SH3-like domain-containing protein n=1 Tax=Nicotiana tabacum TaxID=4097 RepID=A0A1S4C0M6_TOBAC|nr:PREDICTED: uncharacterized protein LOC107813834 [Nicotiana tabacum]